MCVRKREIKSDKQSHSLKIKRVTEIGEKERERESGRERERVEE